MLSELSFHKSAAFREDPIHWANKFTLPRLDTAVDKLLKRNNRLMRQRQQMVDFAMGEPMVPESRPTLQKILGHAIKNKEQVDRNYTVLRTMDDARRLRYDMHPEEDILKKL